MMELAITPVKANSFLRALTKSGIHPCQNCLGLDPELIDVYGEYFTQTNEGERS